jgi:hypothetical protein
VPDGAYKGALGGYGRLFFDLDQARAAAQSPR